jgi:hypothetical protein
MTRVYRIRDTQRYVFLFLLFPVVPLFLQIIRPSWTLPLLLLCGGFFALFCFVLLHRRGLMIGHDHIRIGSGRFTQEVSHEILQEILFVRHRNVLLRLDGRTRYFRVTPDDYDDVIAALRSFAWRNAIPLGDKRPGHIRRRS